MLETLQQAAGIRTPPSPQELTPNQEYHWDRGHKWELALQLAKGTVSQRHEPHSVILVVRGSKSDLNMSNHPHAPTLTKHTPFSAATLHWASHRRRRRPLSRIADLASGHLEDGWADPKSRSTSGFCSLHHRSIRFQNCGFYFWDPPGDLDGVIVESIRSGMAFAFI